MRNFFSKMIIALFFIILDINIGIDFLPDIIGYFLIASALAKLSGSHSAKMAFWLAVILGLLSLVEMPIFQGALASEPILTQYSFSLVFGTLLLSYYYAIFNVCLELLKDSPYIRYTTKVKYMMLTSTWLTLMTPVVQLHLNENDSMIFLILIIVLTSIAFFIFLIYLYKMMRYVN